MSNYWVYYCVILCLMSTYIELYGMYLICHVSVWPPRTFLALLCLQSATCSHTHCIDRVWPKTRNQTITCDNRKQFKHWDHRSRNGFGTLNGSTLCLSCSRIFLVTTPMACFSMVYFCWVSLHLSSHCRREIYRGQLMLFATKFSSTSKVIKGVEISHELDGLYCMLVHR